MAEKIKINRLKAVLADQGVSQKEIAEKLNVSANTISRICNNESQPRLNLLRDIALALHVDIRELLIPTPAKKDK